MTIPIPMNPDSASREYCTLIHAPESLAAGRGKEEKQTHPFRFGTIWPKRFTQEALRSDSYHTVGQVRIPERNRMPNSPEYAQSPESPANPITEIHILWITAGLGCDGDTIAITAATQPSIEDVLLGGFPWIPKVQFAQSFSCLRKRRRIRAPFPSRPPKENLRHSFWWWKARFPTKKTRAKDTGPPSAPIKHLGNRFTTCDWIDRLAPKAWAVVAAGTCATYGGIHAMEGNPTGCMGLADYLGWQWKSTAGIPIVCVPGCPVQPDNFTEVLLYLLNMAAGRAPMIPLDDALRPTWLFGATVHEGCDRGGYYEQAQFAEEYGSPTCIVKLGCWGPVVQCNVGKRGWMGGIGGCPNVGGICIGCTMPGFPDKFMPFMNQPPGSLLSSSRGDDLWPRDSCVAPIHASVAE